MAGGVKFGGDAQHFGRQCLATDAPQQAFGSQLADELATAGNRSCCELSTGSGSKAVRRTD